MIAICVPVYNFDVQPLIEALKKQMAQFPNEFKLYLIDDGSASQWRSNDFTKVDEFFFLQLDKNCGRSAIRNLFLEVTTEEYLLFLDCDAIVHTSDFLKKYLDCVSENPRERVVCGGRVYPDVCPSQNQFLRWNYGRKRESQPAHVRMITPNTSFMTNNFLVMRSVFDEVRFDEELSGYGHEDTLFGIALEQHQIPIHHIENPILNGDIETNEVFLEKTRQGVKNLAYIFTKVDAELRQRLSAHITLVRVYQKTRGFHFMLRPLTGYFLGAAKMQARKKGSSLFVFNFFKFALLLKILRT